MRCGGDLEQVHAIEPIVTSSVASCEELMGSGMDSGVYRLQDCELNSAGRDFYTRYCDMRTDGGGWTVSDHFDVIVERYRSFGSTTLFYLNSPVFKDIATEITAPISFVI
jgi:hypothetical protein